MLRNATLLLLSLALCLVHASAQQNSPEAIAQLERIASHYSHAASKHIEATIIRTSRSELSSYSTTGILSIWTSDGNRFRYDGRTNVGSALLVSDGTHEWHLRRSFDQYDEADTGSWFRRPSAYVGDDEALIQARGVVTSIEGMHGKIDLARFAPAETLKVQGRKIKATVIQFEYKQNVDRDHSQPIAWHNTIWFDSASLTVLKIERHSRSQIMQGMVTPPHGVWIENLDQTIFTQVDLRTTPANDIFNFTPPAGSNEVAKLPSLLPIPGSSDPFVVASAQYIGKPLPALVLHDASGADVTLNRFHGHPMLIDVWATWCGPCIHDMPALAKLRASTTSTDLQIVGIDQDEKTSDAIAYLKKNNYDWPDFHLTETAEKQLSAVGIPLVLLVDATGNIVYYQTGEGSSKNLAAAIHKLGPTYEKASAE
ncbi:MAG TPA: TlpA disulfide reductase family protein [Edaphobacter sp.]